MAPIRFAVAVVLAVAAVPATASAATVSYRPPVCYRECGEAVVTFRAAAGEHNRLTVALAGDQVELRDQGALVTPRRRCTAVDAHAVRCPAGIVFAHLGDEDDQAATTATGHVDFRGDDGDDELSGSFRGHGGAGNDRIDRCTDAWGDEGDDLLIAAPKDSHLAGGPGTDHLQGGAGNDVLHDASPDANRFDGGEGSDAVSFRGRTTPVAVDLAAPGPLMTSIEAVEGGDGPDVLHGTDGPDLLQGDRGDDVLSGRGGDDRLAGGPGFDRFDAGGGDDVVYSDSYEFANIPYLLDLGSRLPVYWDAEPEPVDCGPGRDRVERLGGDLIDPNCERLNETVVPTPRRVRRGWSWSIPCRHRWRWQRRCRGTVTLDPGTYGHGGFREPPQRRRFATRGRRARVVFPYLPDDVFEIRLHALSRRGPVLIRWRLDADCFERRYRESRCGSRPGT